MTKEYQQLYKEHGELMLESFKELNDIEDVHKKKYGRASTGRFHYTEKKEYHKIIL